MNKDQGAVFSFSFAFRFGVLACLFLEWPVQAQNRVLFLGGGGATSTHNAEAMGAVMMPLMRSQGMTVDYKTNEGILHPDSLKVYDILFLYNSKKGSGGTGADKSPDLTAAQEDALLAWVNAGHAVIAAHSATSSYLSNPKYAQLLGAEYLAHGEDLQSIRVTAPNHPAMLGVSAPPSAANSTYWDEGRTHRFLQKDTVILAVSNSNGNPWTWVRPQGQGWVYYTSSGHDARCWNDANFQKQILQALKWGLSLSPVVVHRLGSRGKNSNAKADIIGWPSVDLTLLGRAFQRNSWGERPFFLGFVPDRPMNRP